MPIFEQRIPVELTDEEIARVLADRERTVDPEKRVDELLTRYKRTVETWSPEDYKFLATPEAKAIMLKRINRDA